jgi:hypothetical protein
MLPLKVSKARNLCPHGIHKPSLCLKHSHCEDVPYSALFPLEAPLGPGACNPYVNLSYGYAISVLQFQLQKLHEQGDLQSYFDLVLTTSISTNVVSGPILVGDRHFSPLARLHNALHFSPFTSLPCNYKSRRVPCKVPVCMYATRQKHHCSMCTTMYKCSFFCSFFKGTCKGLFRESLKAEGVISTYQDKP